MSELTKKVRSDLLEKQDKKFRDFHKSLCTTSKYEMIGIRTPEIRKTAKEFDINMVEQYMYSDDEKYYEEVLLKGFIIGNSKISIEKTFEYLEHFIPKIDNWAICDGTCASLKITKKNLDKMWIFLQNYIKSNKEYEIRFAVVMYLDYYTKTKYLKEIFNQIDKIKNEEYYVKMAIAWFIAEAFVNAREQTLQFIKKTKIDKWTFNKAIQKIKESYRVSEEDKQMLNKLKK